MSLSILPPELLRMVLIQRSKRGGLRALFPIRATCRALRDEVNQVLFFESPIIAFRRSRCVAAIHGHTAAFLLNKLHKPLDVKPELPALLHKMVDFLCKSLNIAEKDERSCQWRLCVGVVRYFGASFIRDLLVHQHKVKEAKLPAYESNELMDRYKVVAAMLFGAPHLVDHLWAAFFMAACSSTTYSTARSAFKLDEAFGEALELSRADFANDIASVATPIIPDFLVFHRWLALAIPLRNMELFTLILRQYPGYVQNRHIDNAIKFGTFEMVTAILDVCKIKNVNDTRWCARRGECFIDIACGAGNMEVIQGFIDAGAKVTDTALAFALKNDEWEAFVHLRDLGGPLPPMDKWPRKCSRDMYEELCAMKVEDGVEKSLLPSYNNFKRLSWQALRKLEVEIDPFALEE